MTSDVDVVYDESKGKLFLNDNGTAQCWGKRKVSRVFAKFKEKPKLTTLITSKVFQLTPRPSPVLVVAKVLLARMVTPKSRLLLIEKY